MTKLIVISGTVRAGKSTLSKNLQNRFGADHCGVISTGAIARNMMTKEALEAISKGGLHPDEDTLRETIGVHMESCILSCHRWVILEGFPRNDSQATWLLSQIKRLQHMSLFAYIHVDAPVSVRYDRARLSKGEFDTKEIFGNLIKRDLDVIDLTPRLCCAVQKSIGIFDDGGHEFTVRMVHVGFAPYIYKCSFEHADPMLGISDTIGWMLNDSK